MAGKNKLSPDQLDEMISLFAKGYSANKIQEYVKNTYSIDISIQAICRHVKRIRKARQEATDLAFKEAIGKSAIKDIDIIDKKIKQLDQISDELLKKKDYKFAKEFQEVLLKYVSKKIDLNSGNQGDETEDLLNSLLDKINDK